MDTDDSTTIIQGCMKELRDLGVPRELIQPAMEIVSRRYIEWCLRVVVRGGPNTLPPLPSPFTPTNDTN